jgi:hypothetical protein
MLAGVQFKVLAFRLNARYAIGLNNIGDLPDEDQWKSKGFQVSVGLAH